MCQKAFNNPLSLERHKYMHKEKRFMYSTCNEGFQFMSQLRLHKVTHQRRSKHFCAYPGCYKKFKNKPDLNRHAKSHTSKETKCPDCPYRTKDKRNLNLIEGATVILNVTFVRNVERVLSITRKRNVIY